MNKMQFRPNQIISTVQHVMHKYFILVIISSYVIASIYPSLGVHIRSIELGSIDAWRTRITFSLPPAMLAFLLFNAGLGVRTKELAGLLRNPSLLLVGALGNLFVPLAFVVGVSITMKLWHNSDEVQQILTGLALVASMPIAGASTAWAQNANGNLAVSLGLILLTTLCSPVLTPIVLDSVGFVTTGDYSEDLHELAANGAGGFLAIWVILPSLLSMLTHWILGEKRVALISPYLKLSNFGVLALLNYSNASISLPGVLSQPDPDFVLVMLIVVILLCFVMFGAGYLVSRAFGADRAGTVSLMFGLGMNNNGAGLVLASMTLSDHPGVMLPIIFYNLIQHFVASLIDKTLSRAHGGD